MHCRRGWAPGKNIPCDLHMEHLNRECKNSMRGLGANVTDIQIGRSLCNTVEMLDHFDSETGVPRPSGCHTRRSSQSELHKVVKQLVDTSKVFRTQPGRCYKHFPNFKANITRNLSFQDLKQWMGEQYWKILTYDA